MIYLIIYIVSVLFTAKVWYDFGKLVERKKEKKNDNE